VCTKQRQHGEEDGEKEEQQEGSEAEAVEADGKGYALDLSVCVV
jgi:hypothetical protein